MHLLCATIAIVIKKSVWIKTHANSLNRSINETVRSIQLLIGLSVVH